MTFQNLISPKSRQKYIKKQSQPLIIKQLRLNFVIPLGFEPKTHSLEGCCSIQLSYGTPAALSHAALCTWRRAPVKQEGSLATAKVIQFCLLSK